MYNRYKIQAEHLNVTRAIAKHVINIEQVKKDTTPIYLSRTKLKRSNRLLIGEDSVEEYCRSIGFKVVYPEQLSLMEQIVLFNTHNIFIGFIGSAFHTMLFRIYDEKAMCVYLTDGAQYKNYECIDSLMGNNTKYIKCTENTSIAKKEYCIDQDMAIKYISKMFK
jgi:capsular polysaccharide biosynthesis protein